MDHRTDSKMRVTDKGSTSACQVVTAMDEWWGCTCQKLPLTNVNDVLMTQSARLAHARSVLFDLAVCAL
ncbi:uncharacterized protein MYCGRDRAFT_106205 [Zymoseptoria tritici IPO323]|uniref:Uncharacterized protein n=1 Tax=Zymoseptoria tritici (strain CBS 115943 / IPO323) TaxID=336722 RepID=F9XM34_ZYMTI|nr:uncharacterized protein MYCGRDRAFT_106205 [Zymoseptoria tritici IPO323]EGP83518.1 hypothetical protein MYCGRDRAFT_106205 [Zymoseptoria tritici IPO323]